MHAHVFSPPFVIRQQQRQQLYWYSYLELKFTRHGKPRSSNRSIHYPYNTFQHCNVRFYGGISGLKQLSEKNGGNVGKRANETINYLSMTAARSVEDD